LETEVAKHDLVISLIPYTYHAEVVKAAIKASKRKCALLRRSSFTKFLTDSSSANKPIHVVTTSYVSPAMRALDEEAKKAGVIVYNEIGLDPGIDHLWAVKAIGDVRAKGGKVRDFVLLHPALRFFFLLFLSRYLEP
jgi:saccharopine dehydrogenase-like NADP-dependent oxidoreductase